MESLTFSFIERAPAVNAAIERKKEMAVTVTDRNGCPIKFPNGVKTDVDTHGNLVVINREGNFEGRVHVAAWSSVHHHGSAE